MRKKRKALPAGPSEGEAEFLEIQTKAWAAAVVPDRVEKEKWTRLIDDPDPEIRLRAMMFLSEQKHGKALSMVRKTETLQTAGGKGLGVMLVPVAMAEAEWSRKFQALEAHPGAITQVELLPQPRSLGEGDPASSAEPLPE